MVLLPLASLKLTVALFCLAIFLILAGTLAQASHDIWWVLYNYFRTPLAWIELKNFFPPAWFSQYPTLLDLPGSFPFPGGFTIGGLMALNLLAAHGLRFKVQARGKRLWTGLAVIAIGCLVTVAGDRRRPRQRWFASDFAGRLAHALEIISRWIGLQLRRHCLGSVSDGFPPHTRAPASWRASARRCSCCWRFCCLALMPTV